jgi:hypothetical protein
MGWRRVGLYYALLAVALGYYRASAPDGGDVATEHDRPMLLDVRLDRISEVALSRGSTTVRCGQHKGRWRVVDPEGVLLPADLISTLVTTLVETRVTEVVATTGRLGEEFGLDGGFTRLELYRQGHAVPATVLLGALNPTRTAIYARRLDSEDVVLVGRVLQYYTERIFEEVRRRRAGPPGDADAGERIGSPSGPDGEPPGDSTALTP